MGLTLLHSCAGIIATCEPSVKVLHGAAILVRDDVIESIGPSKDLLLKYSNSSAAIELVDCSEKWLIPGLINTHVHTSQQLGRGIADDVDLLTWLHKRIWPYESAMTEHDSYISTLLCCIELIRSGVTCFAEAGGQHVAGMARAVSEAGIRACLTRSTMDSGDGLPATWADTSAVREIAEQESLFQRYNNSAEGRVRVWLGIRQILNATDDLLSLTHQTAVRLNTGIHMHVSEIPVENAYVAESRGLSVGQGTVTHLHNKGCLSPHLLAAHSVWVSDHEVRLMAEGGVSAVHCPGAAMRMLGFSPVSLMLSLGVNVSLGTDGAPSNNRMSLVDEMYVAALVNKGKVSLLKQGETDPTELPASTILKMATINGARTVRWQDQIGSLEEGKKADVVVIDPHNYAMTPLHNPVSSLVYSMRTENIQSVMCNGRWIMRDRQILTLDERRILAEARSLSQDLLSRAGVKVSVPGTEFVCF